MNVAHDQGNSFFLAMVVIVMTLRIDRELTFKAHDAELSPACGKIGFSKLADCEMRTHFFIISDCGRTIVFPSTTFGHSFAAKVILKALHGDSGTSNSVDGVSMEYPLHPFPTQISPQYSSALMMYRRPWNKLSRKTPGPSCWPI